VIVNSSSPTRLMAELIQCHVCSCFSQNALRLFFATLLGVTLCIGAESIPYLTGNGDNANDYQLQ
jgi:hypothetical protein